jgi:hypothetical protein
MYVSPYFVALIFHHLKYIIGINAAVFGTLSVWLVRAADWDITSDWKWIFPAVCYLVAFAYLALVYYRFL